MWVRDDGDLGANGKVRKNSTSEDTASGTGWWTGCSVWETSRLKNDSKVFSSNHGKEGIIVARDGEEKNAHANNTFAFRWFMNSCQILRTSLGSRVESLQNFLIWIFIYLAVLGRCCCECSLVAESGGYSLTVVCFSRGGFACGAWTLGGSGFSSCGTWAHEFRLPGSRAQA